MANMPSTKRRIGEEPARGRNSPVIRAATSEPSTKPMISGRRYWTTSARCRPSAPAMSRSKQATQIPMLAGLPSFCSTAASTPMTAPTAMMPHLVAKTFFPCMIDYSLGCEGWSPSLPEVGQGRSAAR